MSTKRLINEFSFEGTVDERATSEERNGKVKSSILLRQAWEFRGEFKTTAVLATCWGSDFNSLQKGDHVIVRGRLSSREYTNKATGQPNFWLEVVCDRVAKVLKDEPKAADVSQAPSPAPFGADEIPF